jgi:hypothetical protein
VALFARVGVDHPEPMTAATGRVRTPTSGGPVRNTATPTATSRARRTLRVTWHVDVVNGRTVLRALYSLERPGRPPVILMRTTT